MRIETKIKSLRKQLREQASPSDPFVDPYNMPGSEFVTYEQASVSNIEASDLVDREASGLQHKNKRTKNTPK